VAEQPWRRPGVDRAAFGRVVLVIACLVLPTVFFCVVKSQAASDGTETLVGHNRWDASGIVVTGLVGHPPGLQVGDRVTSINGRPISKLIDGSGGHLEVGQKLIYGLRTRQGDRRKVVVVLRTYDLGAAVLGNWPFVPLVASLDLVAALVFLRRPHEPAAWTILILAVLVPFTAFEWPAPPQVVDLVGGQGVWAYVIGDAASALTLATLLLFALVFPRPWPLLLKRPWLVVPAIGLIGIVPYLLSLPGAVSRADPAARLAGEVYVSAWYARTYPLLTVTALAFGYRRATSPDERRGLRWVLAGCGGALFIYLGLFQIPFSLTGHPLLAPAWEALLLTPLPLSVGAGILRYRLIDVELIIKRSLVYSGLTTGSLAIVVGSMWALSRAVHADLVLFSLAGLVALAVFSARSRVQPMIVRRYFGDRDDPYRVVSRIVELDTGAPAQAALTEAARTIRDALHLAFISVDVTTVHGGFEPVVEIGGSSGRPIHVDLRHGAEVVGRLGLDPGAGREDFGNNDDRLLRDLSVHVGAVVHAVRLNLDLQRSRENLIAAREEERRRIRRDLHDGLGPTLAATAMQIEAAGTLIRLNPTEAEELLHQLRAGVQEAIADIRRLVDDLRPPALDQLGLLSAIRERVVTFNRAASDGSHPFEVVVDSSGDLQDLPAAIEVAVYRITVEAVTNAARHAQARTCRVRLHRGALLTVEVRDDGTGIAQNEIPHVGLHSMRERAEEVGGTCQIGRAPSGGTIVRVTLPVPAPPIDRKASL
jgi:two-component system NarL family sensor kinase